MIDYMTRVELHDAVSADYTKLHEAMARQGFERTVCSDDGKTYQLPTAEYAYSGSASLSDVYAKASAAAATVKPGSWILVSKTNELYFRLAEVPSARRYG